MKLEHLDSIEDIRRFLNGTDVVIFNVLMPKQARYLWVHKVLKKHLYSSLSKPEKGAVAQYLMKVTGYSRSQIKRLIQQFVKTNVITLNTARNNGFKSCYTPSDIRLLAEMDERHQQPSGAVIIKLCERAYSKFGHRQYENLANLSVSHLYNLRRSKTYQSQRLFLTKKRSTVGAMGNRRKVGPNDQPGYIHIDSSYQGDIFNDQGVYHINAVDAVTQFQVKVTVERITPTFLRPAIQQILDLFPFKIQGFHIGNSGEYANHNVDTLLNKLFLEFSKTRSSQINEDALVEANRVSINAKRYGHQHTLRDYASQSSTFNQTALFRYVNFHRPCYFATTVVDKDGNETKQYIYRDIMTPYDKLISLPNSKQYLKSNITLGQLDRFSKKLDDNDAAEALNKARGALSEHLYQRHDLSA